MVRHRETIRCLVAAGWLFISCAGNLGGPRSAALGVARGAGSPPVDDSACLLQSRTETAVEQALALDEQAEAETEVEEEEEEEDQDGQEEDLSGAEDKPNLASAAGSTGESADGSREVPLDKPFRQTMVNFGDAQYISYLVLGHQLIGGILDTGSFELVVFSSTCGSCGAAAQYNPWLSSTYGVGQLKTTQSYGSGDTFSEEAFDLVSIGPFADTNQSFWEVTKANMPILYNAAFQGIIGVGPPETPAADAWTALQKTASNISNATDDHMRVDESLLLQAVDRLEVAMEVSARPTLLRNLNVSMFSMCVSRSPGADGYFIWNDYTALRKPSLFAKVPVVGTHTWSVELKNVRLKDAPDPKSGKGSVKQIGCTDGCSAIIDSGTSLLAVPGFVIEELQGMMESLDADCSNIQALPSLVFNMGDGQFTLPPDSYVAEVVGQLPNYIEGYTTVEDNSTSTESSDLDPDSIGRRTASRSRCQLLLMESFASTKYGPLWILGIPFFRRYYTTFRIGKSHTDRTLFIAPSTEDCYAEGAESGKASLLDVGARTNYHRRIDASRVTVPPLAHKAVTSSFMHL